VWSSACVGTFSHDPMKPVIFWGGTGQAKVLAEALDPREWRIVAIVDRRAIDSPLAGVPMLLGEQGLHSFVAGGGAPAGANFAVAVGGPGRDRLQLFDKMLSLGLSPISIVHPRAFIARDAHVAQGAQVLAMAAVCSHVKLGRAVIVNTSASVDHDCVVEDGVHIAPGARLAGEVHVGEAAFIGAGAIVLPRLRIGALAVVGAGAVVTRDVPDNAVVVGIPARKMERT
jgi:sugar O-acyltransferase (sialic acid O-acetyltransferase NeuD family)